MKRSKSRSREGAWIEIRPQRERCCCYIVAPARERGLKLVKGQKNAVQWVAPARERGLKLLLAALQRLPIVVAPARERGLKSRIFLN